MRRLWRTGGGSDAVQYAEDAVISWRRPAPRVVASLAVWKPDGMALSSLDRLGSRRSEMLSDGGLGDIEPSRETAYEEDKNRKSMDTE